MPKRRRKTDQNTYKYRDNCESKTRYESQAKALEAADFRMLENMSVALTVYKCDICNGWHLTRAKQARG